MAKYYMYLYVPFVPIFTHPEMSHINELMFFWQVDLSVSATLKSQLLMSWALHLAIVCTELFLLIQTPGQEKWWPLAMFCVQPKWTDMNSASNHCISEERCGWCWFSVLLHAATIVRKKSWTGSSALQSCLLERIPFGLLRKPSSSESTESLGQESLMHRQVPKMASPWLLCYYKQWAHAQNNAAEKLDMLVTGTSRRSIQLAVELPLRTYLLPDINSLTNAL